MTNAARDAALQESTKAPEISEKSRGKRPQKYKFGSSTRAKPKEGESTTQNSQILDGAEETDQESSEANSDKVQANLPPTSNTESDNDSFEPEIDSELENMNESLIQVVNSGWDGLEIAKFVANKYHEDLFFKQIQDNPRSYRNFEVSDGLVFLNLSDRKMLCIPNLTFQGRSIREIVISEAHSVLAHLGARKTLDYLCDLVWWKDMVDDTKSFCETCETCMRTKPSNQKPYGLLNSLLPPSLPWDSIGVDFVGPLPESKNRDGVFNSIAVVIDLLTGMVHLIPSRINYTARQMAELMFEHIYKLHGLPKSIVSDRDVLFTSTFWKRLHGLIGTKLHV
jgi:hypothetical protein